MINPLRSRLQVKVCEFTFTVLAPLTEDITRASEVMSGGAGEETWTGHAGRFAEARSILLPLIVLVELDGKEVDGWQEFIAESDLLAGTQVLPILQACCFRSAGEVVLVDPV